jgi:hypothetical protein
MSAPYVSIKRLSSNSMAAMLAAVEIYNKPQMTYRDEVVVINVVNAWELALKAALRQKRRSIYYPKKKGERYRSLSLDDCLARVTNASLWSDGLDGPAMTANLKALSEFRNRAIHLYNAPGLGTIIYPFLQQNILNYRDFVLAKFNKDLAEHMTWQLLPLGATIPSDAVRFMRGSPDTQTIAEVQDFIDDVRVLMDRAEQAGSDMGRVATIYDINLQSVKKMSSADLIVAVSSDAEGQIVMKKSDPNQTHPYTATELIKKVNARREGRTLNGYDHQAVCWDEDLRDASAYAWKHSNAATHVWSGAAVTYLAGKTDSDYDAARARYREHKIAERAKNG